MAEIPHKVNLVAFEQCCGIKIISNLFDNIPWTFKGDGYGDPLQRTVGTYNGYKSQKSVDDLYNIPNKRTETMESYRDRIRNEVKDWQKAYLVTKSYLLLVLNRQQEQEIGDVIRELGFEVLVPETKNPTGTSITLYIYHLIPRNSEPVKSILSK